MEIKKLDADNFADFEKLTSQESHGGCYCSFWHQKWASMADWEKCKKETPEYNRNIVFEKVRSGFHAGVLAYEGSELLAWISVGPVTDFYWTWLRTALLGDSAKTTAGILCVAIEKKFRRQGLQVKLLGALKVYGKAAGWTSLEGYPFDPSALEKHGAELAWPGLAPAFEKAGFKRTGVHWLSNPQAERSIYQAAL